MYVKSFKLFKETNKSYFWEMRFKNWDINVKFVGNLGSHSTPRIKILVQPKLECQPISANQSVNACCPASQENI